MNKLLKKITLLLLFYDFHLLFAQAPQPATGGRAAGMANTSLNFTDPWAFFNNIGGISGVKQWSVMTAYHQPMNFAPFQTFVAGILTPLPYGVAGMGISRFGDELFSHQKISLGYAFETNQVHLGLKINYQQIQIQDLRGVRAFSFEFGGIARFIPKLSFGAFVSNFTNNAFRTESGPDETIPVVLRSGFSYQPIEALLINAEVEKEIDQDIRVKTGLEYRLIKNVFLRTGLQIKPLVNSFGVGFHTKSILLDYALESNSLGTGLAQHLSLTYKFKKKEQSKKDEE